MNPKTSKIEQSRNRYINIVRKKQVELRNIEPLHPMVSFTLLPPSLT
jgi:hypothetical protein